MTTSDIRSHIETVSARHGLDANLVESIVLTESSGNTYATRPEPQYRYLVNAKTGKPFRFLSPSEAASKLPPSDFPSIAPSTAVQEWWGQQSSWGLMQTMGAVARELGFKSAFFAELCDPITGLHFGCKHFANQLARAKGDVNQALRAYNAGRGGAESVPAHQYQVKVNAWLLQITGAATRRA